MYCFLYHKIDPASAVSPYFLTRSFSVVYFSYLFHTKSPRTYPTFRTSNTESDAYTRASILSNKNCATPLHRLAVYRIKKLPFGKPSNCKKTLFVTSSVSDTRCDLLRFCLRHILLCRSPIPTYRINAFVFICNIYYNRL